MKRDCSGVACLALPLGIAFVSSIAFAVAMMRLRRLQAFGRF
jgi:hypothetical protein